MNAEDLQQVAFGVGTLIAIAYTGFQARLGRKKAENAVGHAEKAVEQTKATGNGFAGRIEASLARIEGKIDRHIEDHASSDLRK